MTWGWIQCKCSSTSLSLADSLFTKLTEIRNHIISIFIRLQKSLQNCIELSIYVSYINDKIILLMNVIPHQGLVFLGGIPIPLFFRCLLLLQILPLEVFVAAHEEEPITFLASQLCQLRKQNHLSHWLQIDEKNPANQLILENIT